MNTTVFVPGREHPSANAGRLQPAFRAWADALIRRAAGAESCNAMAVLTSIRPTARIGRLRQIGYYVNPIAVDLSTCRIAANSDALDIYFPLRWRDDLLEFLVDQGFDRDHVEELVLPCAAPMVAICVDAMDACFRSVPNKLLSSVEHYFEHDISAYVRSIGLVGAHVLTDDHEILIPDHGSSEEL